MFVMTCEQLRKIEALSVKNGVGYDTLMKNAGKAASEFIKTQFNISDKSKVLVLAGKGNNGGDGFVIALDLIKAGYQVTTMLMEGEPKTETSRKFFDKLKKKNARILYFDEQVVFNYIEKADIIVDSIYGIGFHGEVNNIFKSTFNAINQSSAKVVSIDMPSGINGDSSKLTNCYIKADYTISFSALKLAQVLYPSSIYCGEVLIRSVGINKNIIESSDFVMRVTDDELVRQNLTPRSLNANKGNFGRLLCINGSMGMAGAAILSARAAVKSGVGLVDVAIPKSIYNIVGTNLVEPIFTLLECTSTGVISEESMPKLTQKLDISTACLLGCGLSVTKETEKIVCDIVKTAKCPLVIDADGINILSNNIDILQGISGENIIITPHPGEMARLLNTTVEDVQENRMLYASDFAKKYNIIVVLKGYNTLVAIPNGEVYVNRTGNPGMAQGGSGDVLAGIIASFAAQGIDLKYSAAMGVYIHGLAGDLSAKKFSQIAMTPSDIVECIGEVLKQILL